jgi:hypothetical protein
MMRCILQAQQLAKLRYAVQRLLQRQLASAFYGWRCEAARFTRLRCAVQRLVHRQLAAAFSGWRKAGVEQRRLVVATGGCTGCCPQGKRLNLNCVCIQPDGRSHL